jgi:hypothetical protein
MNCKRILSKRLLVPVQGKLKENVSKMFYTTFGHDQQLS